MDAFTYRLSAIPAGEKGTDATVGEIKRLLSSGMKDPALRERTIRILRSAGVDSHQPRQVARQIYRWIQRHIRYVNDPIDIETVQAPNFTLRLQAGDCDDHAALVAAMLSVVGIPARLVVIGADPNHFEHIYPEAFIDGNWITVDTTRHDGFDNAITAPAQKIYPVSGEDNMVGKVQPVDTARYRAAVYAAAMKTITQAVNRGKVNLFTLQTALDRVSGNEWPGAGSVAADPMRKALADAVAQVRLISARRGLSQSNIFLNGWLDDAWNTVKQSARTIYDEATRKGININIPDISLPNQVSLIQTTTPPDAVRAGVDQFFTKPVVIIAAVAIAAYFLRK